MGHKLAFLALASGLCAAPASAAVEKGMVIVSISVPPSPSVREIQLQLRSRDHLHTSVATLRNIPSDPSAPPDETVQQFAALSLAPGKWEIYNFRVQTVGGAKYAKRDVSIPFNVRGGAAIYIGDYLAGEVLRKSAAGVYASNLGFVVSDRPPPAEAPSFYTVAVPDVAAAGSPYFASADESDLLTNDAMLTQLHKPAQDKAPPPPPEMTWEEAQLRLRAKS